MTDDEEREIGRLQQQMETVGTDVTEIKEALLGDGGLKERVIRLEIAQDDAKVEGQRVRAAYEKDRAEAKRQRGKILTAIWTFASGAILWLLTQAPTIFKAVVRWATTGNP